MFFEHNLAMLKMIELYSLLQFIKSLAREMWEWKFQNFILLITVLNFYEYRKHIVIFKSIIL